MNRTCCNCRFYLSGLSVGECRKNAPTFTDERDGWPCTRPTDWCGEWKRKLGPVPAELKPENHRMDQRYVDD